MSLEQLLEKYGESLYAAFEALSISEPKDLYEGEELKSIEEAIARIQSEPKTKKNGKKGSIAKTEKKQTDSKGAIAAAAKDGIVATVKVRADQGKKMAQQGNRAMVTGYLSETADGMTEFNKSILGMADAFDTLIEASASEVLEGSVVDRSGEDFLLTESGGSFSLI